MNDKIVQELAEDIFRRKRERRRELAALPVETKFEILLKLQQLAYDVGKSAGRTPREPWKVST